VSQTSGQGGLFSHPAALAAGAAGVGSALLALWAMRGMPLGGLLMWLSPLPVFAAGLAFGARSAVSAVAIAAVLILFSTSSLGLLVYLVVFGLPSAMIVATAVQPGRVELSVPLTLLGLWPVVVLAVLAMAIPDLEAEMRAAVELGMRRMGVSLPEGMVDQVTQVKAAAAGFWMALLMVGNGLAAQALLARNGLALHPSPSADGLHLPGWYPMLPAIGLAAWLAFGGAVALSSLLILLVPVFILGVVGVHRRLRGRTGRVAILAGFYVLMLLFLQIMAPLMVGVGLLDQFRRPSMPPQT
jgi:hypothetical protein